MRAILLALLLASTASAADVDDLCRQIATLPAHEAATVAQVALSYTPPLSRVSMLTAEILNLYGYTLPRDTVVVTVHDTVLVDRWTSDYPTTGGPWGVWVWEMADNPEGPWVLATVTDVLKAWLRVRGVNDEGYGPASESAEVD